jgi:hypothetical protein
MLGRLIDRTTRIWVELTGRKVELASERWLDGPIGDLDVVGDSWLDQLAERTDAQRRNDAGLLGSMATLASPAFDLAALRPEVVDFYEQTSRYRLDVWSQWSPLMWPGGWLISSLFARRLQQLSLPMRPLDVAYGMASHVIALDDPSGTQLGAAWLRTVRATGRSIYSGWYGTTRIPLSNDPVVRVVFPLPKGNCCVFLMPRNGPDGSLILESPIGPFGSAGAYLTVRHGADRVSVRRIPIAETFRVFVDTEGTLRTDHHMKLWSATVIRLHYRMTTTSASR